MKFRYKVLTINIILLSLALGLVGYLMIRRNFELALDTQIKNAVTLNNLTQSSVEYELLDVINSSAAQISGQLSEIGSRVDSGMISQEATLYIRYGENYLYSGDGQESLIPDALFDELSIGSKHYILTEKDGGKFIYVTSYSAVGNENLYVISKQDISQVYSLMDKQIGYFKLLLFSILLLCSALMYIVSRMLTRPLEKLNVITDEFADGNYDARAEIKSGDEIGLLAEKFNNMALSVSNHVDELNDMIKRREQFVADFTHEIKTPMTTIIGYADTMRSMELEREEQIMSLDYIFSEGKRLEAMSMKLFDLIYLKQHDIEMKPVNTAALGTEIEKIMKPSLERKGLTFSCAFAESIISGDRELLKTVFINLIDNARKASEENSEIIFTGENTDGKYIFTVTDEGCGMTEEAVKHICDEFYMVDKSRSRKEGGAGLGMSLALLILERHGAKLDIDSTPGVGTTMRVTFDITDDYHKDGAI
jgi:signal transduction histidine kinase